MLREVDFAGTGLQRAVYGLRPALEMHATVLGRNVYPIDGRISSMSTDMCRV
jgi:hypothetical protein